MANNIIGLKFDPEQALMPWLSTVSGDKKEQSVPTVANDYLSNTPFGAGGAQDFQIHPLILKGMRDQVNHFLNTDKETLAKEADPLTPINQWQAGFTGLDQNERQQWEQSNPRFSDLEDYKKDRVWRNQQFIKNYGLDAFNSVTNPEERDRIHEMNLIGTAMIQKFGDDDNFRELQDLSPKGALELLKSDYKPQWQIKMEKEAKESEESVLLKEPSSKKKENRHFNLFKNWFTSDWGDYSLKDRYDAVVNSTAEGMKEGIWEGTFASIILSGGPLIPAGIILGGVYGGTHGFLEGFFHPEKGAEYNQRKAEAENQDILERIKESDNIFKKDDTRQEAFDIENQYLKAYRSSGNNKESFEKAIDNEFDEIALNKKIPVKDPFGKDYEESYVGSNYYSAFKDTDILKENLSTKDKIKYIAQSKAIANKYGKSAALEVLDGEMQSLVSKNQSGIDWGLNTAKNIWVGGLANLALKGVALQALGAELTGGEESLNEYLSGDKDNWFWFDPQYWNKVDQYNDLGWQWIDDRMKWAGWQNNFAIAEANNGISPVNNVAMPGEEEKFASWYMFNEALRMNKFAWSDLITNIGLAKLVGTATRFAGGIELAGQPGVLATESTIGSKIINKGGSIGVMAASSLGIDAAYGLNTYKEVLDENNRKVDQMVDKDLAEEIAKRASTPAYQQEFKKYVDAVNEQRKANAGEDGKWIPLDEEKAWNEYLNHIGNEIRDEIEQKHAEDRHQAALDAANAYAVDATIEGARMTLTNGLFKSYLFDKGTLNALNINNPYVSTTFRNGQYELGKYAIAKKAAGTTLTQVWGGFQSNYFDDVTVGFAKGFGLQHYNNYLASKYNPAAYGSVIDDYINPWVAASMGATNAMTEHRSFLDGGIGALGSLLTFSPNIPGMMGHMDRMAQRAKEVENDKNNGTNSEISWTEIASDFISNPILQAVADAKAASRMTQREINRANKEIKEHGHTLDNIVEEAERLNMLSTTREGTSIMDAEDAKDWAAFTLASTLLSLKNNGAVRNAQVEVDKSSWSKRRKAADMVARGFNAMMGVQMFDQTSTPYFKAVQTLNDAINIGEEATDEAQAARQQELINTFLGLKTNESITEGMTEEEKEAFAVERIQKNASRLAEMINRAEEIQEAFEKSAYASYHPDVKQQLVFQYIMDDRWRNRKAEQEEWITGDKESESEEVLTSNVVAKYGSAEGYDRAKKAQEKRVSEAQKWFDELTKAKPKANYNPFRSIRETAEEVKEKELLRRWLLSQAEAKLNAEKASLEKMNAEEEDVKAQLRESNTIISAHAILNLNAEDRLRMLDDYYRNDYSPEQQAQIDEAKNLLLQKGVPLNEAMERVRDAAILQQRIHDNMEVAKTIMKNPQAANDMVQALQNNRRNAIIDYFNDKVVREAFDKLNSNPANVVSEENVAKSVQDFSTAVLLGMKETADNLLKNGDEVFSQLVLDNISKGIDKVLSERREKKKDYENFANYISKTKKVNRTETISTPIYIGDAQEGTIDVEQTNEQELSDNDKNLLRAALDYASERDYSVDEMEEKVATDDFWRYVDELNHSGRNIDEQVNPVSPRYMQHLMKDMNTAFKVHQEEIKKDAEAKPVSSKAKSVATPEVNPTVKEEKPAAPGNKAPSNPTPETPEKAPEPEAPIVAESADNQDIIDTASDFGNGHISEDLNVLLDRIDKMKMSDEHRQTIKDTIKNIVQEKHVDNIKSLQEELFENLISEPVLNDIVTNIYDLDVQSLKKSAQNSQKKEGTKEEKQEDKKEENRPAPMVLVSRDLDSMMKMPVWKAYLEEHGVVNFLQKLTSIWNDNSEDATAKKKRERINQAQIRFIYDPSLAHSVEQSIKEAGHNYTEQAVPLLIAMEIAPDHEYLVDNEEQLLVIPDAADNKANKDNLKKYQIIGVFPASEVSRDTESDAIINTADRLGTLRSLINYDLEGPQVLRYGKKGSKIGTTLRSVSPFTSQDAIPHGTADTPKTGVHTLMEGNAESPLESFVKVDASKKEEYEKAKKESLKKVRDTDFYKLLRKTFIDRLFKRERISPDADTRDTKELDFKIQKGSNSTYPKIVLIKRISETSDKNTGRSIVEELQELNPSDSEMASKAKTVIESNSRFKRLFKILKSRKLDTGLFNADGRVSDPSNYNTALSEFADGIKKDILNNLYIDNLDVSVEVSDGIPSEKIVSIKVSSGKELLSTIEIPYQGTLDANNYALFLRDLILDDKGMARPGLNDSRYERVKWQVNYEDVETARSGKNQKWTGKALDNLNDLYDDGVFEMQVTKLAYPAKEVSVDINSKMREELYTDKKPEPETPINNPTGEKAAGDADLGVGTVDGDSGMRIGHTREEILRAASPTIEAINALLRESENSDRTKDNKYYTWMDKIWARVTSMKYAFAGMGNRFPETSGWKTPSTTLGNSYDNFGRDVLNGLFDEMSEAERKEAFKNYDNSTVENYEKVYQALKSFEARLLQQGRAIVKVLDNTGKNSSELRVFGLLNVLKRGKKGNIVTDKVRVAGALDILTVDMFGDLQIYDFKASRKELNKVIAQDSSHGYHIQLSQYANYLESQLRGMGAKNVAGKDIEVTSINIVPAQVEKYPKPLGEGGTTEYQKAEGPTNQLMIKKQGDKNFTEYHDARYEVQPEFELDRLRGNALAAYYDRLSEQEKQDFAELVQELGETEDAEETRPEDIVGVKPIEEKKEEVIQDSDEEDGYSVDGSLSLFSDILGDEEANSEGVDNSPAALDDAISEEDDPEALVNKIKENEKNCGTPPSK